MPTLLADSEKRDPGFKNQGPDETSPHLLLGAQGQRLGAGQGQLLCGPTETSFWQLSEDGNLHGSGTTRHDSLSNSPKPFLRASSSAADAVVGIGYSGWPTSKGGHPCPCHNFFLNFFFYNFLQQYCPNVFSPMGSSGCPPR